MSDEQFASHETAAEAVDLQTQPSPGFQEIDPHDGWAQEPDDEDLPRRPRRRLLAPLPVALLLALLTACGFIGGVLVEKGSASSTTGAAGASGAAGAARFAGLRGAGGAGGASAAAAAATSGGGGAGPGGAGGATTGTVAFIQGSTLYVTNAEGNTVKVKTSAASSVSKTVKSSVAAIHPGESVVITGGSSTGGVITAEAIRVGATGAGSPFAGAGRGGGGSAPSLFGAG
jgi:hypothetical protein